jgi:uncharacterized membrane protein YeaQ/YmgE (transglycosylase-associated protein family)
MRGWTMKVFSFSFKREAVWMIVFSLAPAVIGAIIMLIVLLSR